MLTHVTPNIIWIQDSCTCYFYLISSRGGLVVEQWSNNRLLSATVDQILLGAMIYILNKKEYKVYRRVL